MFTRSVSSVLSRENDVGTAEIHLNPANLVNPVKKYLKKLLYKFAAFR